ncbi:hypothetical protein DEJ05_09305 [Curtobacterium sp. MCLR17_045]|nr:hypothetical protein DEJ05_09305 [Curtobacterium sp. MCLR17_045]
MRSWWRCRSSNASWTRRWPDRLREPTPTPRPTPTPTPTPTPPTPRPRSHRWHPPGPPPTRETASETARGTDV